METSLSPLSANDRFAFFCSEKVACFNDCCRDLNQFLTPYDILRLKNGLHISSLQFLEQYTTEQIGPETGLPVISLKATPGLERKCPFVTPQGCRVYSDRPSSCRMYPLARILSRNRETGRLTEQYLLLQEPHCLGFDGQHHPATVGEWVADQGLDVYNEMNDFLMEIISLKNRLQPGALDLRQRHLFRLALYDIDGFRAHLSKNNSRVPADKLQVLKDDPALLRFGFDWIKEILFK